MHLLQLKNDGGFSLVEYIGNIIPRYAILSHTWGSDDEEVTFQDLMNGTGRGKAGYRKIHFCGKQAAKDGLQHFWVDSCCINKASSAELSEAINSMFRWYRNAERCYVYLSDVSDSISDRRWKPAFRKSRWFTRGWTLQELIAPASVEFFSKEETHLGSKNSLEPTIHEITGIAIEGLRGCSLSKFSVDERFSWAAKRQTKREEDATYCLLGIFDIHMPLIYGEGREKALKRLQKEIKGASGDEILSLNEEQKRILFKSLQFDQISARQMTIKSVHAKSCGWLLEKSEYLDWLDATKMDEHGGFLWIKGKPGTGKSTLMKFAFTNAYKMKDKIVISFFFNARGEVLEKSTIGTYRSLLFQLLERVPSLQCVFGSLGLSTSRISIDHHQWSVESLKLLLEQAIQSLGETPIVCFIDALDECEERQIRDMILFFTHLSELAISAGVRFQVCLSSRHYPHITIHKGLGLVLEGQEGHSQDISIYLDSELKIGHTEVAERIRTELQEKASGVFMWVVLVAEILNKEHDGGRIHVLQKRLQDIPSDLHELFRDILTRDSYRRDELVLCIQWVLFASQPLRPEQLYFAILSGAEPKSLSRWDANEFTMDVIKRFILDSSKGLAEVTKSKTPKVQFIHESVKDFLLKKNGLGTVWPELKSNFQGQSHEMLKRCCLNYMRIDISTYLEIPKSLPKASSQEAASLRESATGAFPFLEYAVRNVLYHADAAAGCGINQKSLALSFPLVCWIELDNLLKIHEVRRHTEDVSLLYVLAEGNMSNLIRVHPSIRSCLEMEGERYGPPLFASLATKSDKAVREFLQAHGVNQSPVSWLQEPGKFKRDFIFSNQRTILSYAAELGDEIIFAFALKTGRCTPDSKDKDGRTPLLYAAMNGHEAIVKLLLGTPGVDVNSKDSTYEGTPLSWAAENGHEAVVKLLLETGKINVNSKDLRSRTPLSCAAGKGREAIVKLLLETGKVEVDSKDEDGWTPLSWAAGEGHEATAKLLLETGKIDVDSKGTSYDQTSLLWAAMRGYKAVVKLLLGTNKADVNLKDKEGYTPLLWATKNGHKAVVELLLETDNVDVNSKDKEGYTPLLWATKNGHKAVVELLLETGNVDVDSKDFQYGRTPLLWATENRHEAIVKLLRETGKVDIDLRNSGRQKPISLAERAAESRGAR